MRRFVAVPACLCMSACLGNSHMPTEGATPVVVQQQEVVFAQQGLRLLSNAQYTHSIHDVLGPSITFDMALPADNMSLGLVAVGNAQAGLQDSTLEAFEHLSYTVAAQVFADAAHRGAVLSCVPQNAQDAACMREFVNSLGLRAFRRPLTAVETQRYVTLGLDLANDGNSFFLGAQQVTAGMLQSPYFLFRGELGDGKTVQSGQVRLTDYEVGTRLAYLLTNSTPDATLLHAVAQGNLATAGGIEAEANRLLTSPAAAAGIVGFFEDYLSLAQMDKLQKDPSTFANFTQAMGPALHTDLARTIEDVLVTHPGDYRDLYTSTRAYVNGDIAGLYGLHTPASPNDFTAVDWPAAQGRAGLLGHAGILAMQAHPNATSPTFRGLFVRNVLMCQGIPPPPANVPPFPASSTTGPQTMRQKLDIHRQSPTCASCHTLMDPIGLALEHFDALGQYREQDQGLPIDASGRLDGVAFTGAQTMGQTLHDSPRVTDCLVRQIFRYTTGRIESSSDAGTLLALNKIFVDGNYRIEPLLLAVVTSDAFRIVPEAP